MGWSVIAPSRAAITWQIVGTLGGALFVTAIRALMGLKTFVPPFLFTEPAWVFGGLVGVICFLLGHGVADDWIKMARGLDVPEHREDAPGWQKFFSPSLDHKVIGVQYTITALVLLVVGGTFALIFRTELAASGLQFLTNDFKLFSQNGLQFYNTLMSLHGMIMIVSILLGIAGLMNYLVPLLHRRARYGLPAPERLLVLDRGPGGCFAPLQPDSRRIRHRLDGLSAAFGQALRSECRCSSWACSWRAGHPSSARST